MRIFQIPFLKVKTDIGVLDWITSEEVNCGKNCERYWIVRTNITIQNAHTSEALHNLSVFLDYAQRNNYQSVLITKDV